MYEGKLVRLRAFDNSDLMQCLDYSNDYQVMRGASGGILYPSTVDDEARAMGNNTSYTSGEYQFAIETKEERRFIGKCGFIKINWKNRVGELAILIGDKACHGKGYGTDAVSTLCRFGFDELNLHKIKATVFSFNKAAIRCYEKCSFAKEGILKEEIYREGAYHDVIMMARFHNTEE
ncbi:MAG: GNAT family N-acetyltransferase [Clostridiales bacterium]|nr:GNAT family N-acetyltransferase [Clostridiales bacterium]